MANDGVAERMREAAEYASAAMRDFARAWDRASAKIHETEGR